MARHGIKAKALRAITMIASTLASGSLYQAGCGDTGYYGDYGYSDYGYYGGYGPIDEDVFQNAADDWSSYIRGDYDW